MEFMAIVVERNAINLLHLLFSSFYTWWLCYQMVVLVTRRQPFYPLGSWTRSFVKFMPSSIDIRRRRIPSRIDQYRCFPLMGFLLNGNGINAQVYKSSLDPNKLRRFLLQTFRSYKSRDKSLKESICSIRFIKSFAKIIALVSKLQNSCLVETCRTR